MVLAAGAVLWYAQTPQKHKTMNFRELIFPITLSALSVWAINSFFTQTSSENTEPRAGQQLKVVPSPEAARPLFKEVHLEKACIPTHQEITAGASSIIIDEETASISALRITRSRGHSDVLLPIIESDHPTRTAFLVAFDEKAPCSFTLADRQDDAEKCTLIFKGSYKESLINKKITIIAATLCAQLLKVFNTKLIVGFLQSFCELTRKKDRFLIYARILLIKKIYVPLNSVGKIVFITLTVRCEADLLSKWIKQNKKNVKLIIFL